jgi:hypothetical protein
LITNKIKGPCWLSIPKDSFVKAGNLRHSRCLNEIILDDPDVFTIKNKERWATPPLKFMFFSVKTVRNK